MDNTVTPGETVQATRTPLRATVSLVAGVSLWLLRPCRQRGEVAGIPSRPLDREASSRRKRVVAVACAGAVALIGALTAGEYLTGFDLGIDQLLVEDRSTEVIHPGRMLLATALGFVLVGSALALLHLDHALWLAQGLGLGAALIAALVLIGYLYGAAALHSVRYHTDMALHTALGFLLLSAGAVCARPDAGVMAVVSSRRVGGVTARRLLPAVIVVPVAAGWVRLAGERVGLYETAFGLALVIASSIVVLVGFVWSHARSLDRASLERERVEEARARSEARFRAVVESAPDAVVIVDVEGRITLLNGEAERLFGYARAELLGRPVEVLLPEGLQGGVGRDLLGRHREGGEIPVEISLSPLQSDAGPMVTAVIRDITERKRSEDEIRRRQREAEKLARENARLATSLEARVVERTAELEAANRELEAFTYSVSHDLRAPLRAIDGFSRMLLDKHGQGISPDARRYLDIVRENTLQMGQLIDDLLTFSRLGRQPLEKRAVDARSLVRDVPATLGTEQEGRRVDLRLETLPACDADAALLKQVFANLLSNALKFTRTREVARIEVGCRQEGNEAVWFVRDNGVGFDMRYVDKLFGVFQRLHRAEEYEGTGVGLAIVERIVHRHGGRVWAEAEVDRGTTVFFTLGGGAVHA